MEADTAPRMTNREGETDERSTDLVGSDSSSLERGSETLQIQGTISFHLNNFDKSHKIKTLNK